MQSLIICTDNTVLELAFMVLLLAPPADQPLGPRFGWVSWAHSSAQRLLVPVPVGIKDLGAAVSSGRSGPRGSPTCGDGQPDTAHEGAWPWSSVPAGDRHRPPGCAGAGHQRRWGQGQLLAKGIFCSAPVGAKTHSRECPWAHWITLTKKNTFLVINYDFSCHIHAIVTITLGKPVRLVEGQRWAGPAASPGCWQCQQLCTEIAPGAPGLPQPCRAECCIRSLKCWRPFLRIYRVSCCSAEQDPSTDAKSSPLSALPRLGVFNPGQHTTEVAIGPLHVTRDGQWGSSPHMHTLWDSLCEIPWRVISGSSDLI